MPDIAISLEETRLNFDTHIAQIPAASMAVLNRIRTETLQAQGLAVQSATDAGKQASIATTAATQVQQQANTVKGHLTQVEAMAGLTLKNSEIAVDASKAAQSVKTDVTSARQQVQGIQQDIMSRGDTLLSQTEALTARAATAADKATEANQQGQSHLSEGYRLLKQMDGIDRLVQSQVNIAEAHALDSERAANASKKETDNCQGYVGQCQSISRKINAKLKGVDEQLALAKGYSSQCLQYTAQAEQQVDYAKAYADKAQKGEAAAIEAQQANRAVQQSLTRVEMLSSECERWGKQAQASGASAERDAREVKKAESRIIASAESIEQKQQEAQSALDSLAVSSLSLTSSAVNAATIVMRSINQ